VGAAGVIVCKQCGIEFVRSRFCSRQFYCSVICQQAFRRERDKARKHQQKAAPKFRHCREVLKPGRLARTFCSDRCEYLAQSSARRDLHDLPAAEIERRFKAAYAAIQRRRRESQTGAAN